MVACWKHYEIQKKMTLQVTKFSFHLGILGVATSCTDGHQHTRFHQVDMTPKCRSFCSQQKNQVPCVAQISSKAFVGRSGAAVNVMVRTMFATMTSALGVKRQET